MLPAFVSLSMVLFQPWLINQHLNLIFLKTTLNFYLSYPHVNSQTEVSCMVYDAKKTVAVYFYTTTVHFFTSLSDLVCYIWHNSDMSCSLNFNCKSSLMFCTVSCDSSWKDFTSFRNIFSEFCYILVIDFIIFFTAEYTNFFSSASASSLHWRVRSFASIVSHDCFLLSYSSHLS